MAESSKQPSAEKESLHPRNLHRGRYNLKQLCKSSPELAAFVSTTPNKESSIDFSDPEAVKTLNKALLKHFYGVSFWDIPEGYLCPPIPGRADYVHYIADLLGNGKKSDIPKGQKVNIMDVGVGANCVYPLIGNSVYGWHFVGTDIDNRAINAARKIVTQNNLDNRIECRLQTYATDIFKDIIKPGEVFDATMCNPPFHSSLKEAMAGTVKKWTNLGLSKEQKPVLNFGGQNGELWCHGGEAAFINRMAEQSALIPKTSLWFTTLVSKKQTLPGIYKTLEYAKVAEVKTISMAQGQKVSRIVAWTFFSEEERAEWRSKRWTKA
ncbi:23S rRNA (adenine(1618)-N(6))-methyltransferase RlmF [Mucilaginibacter sp.]|uniref:23S rRNA (adenine(1618)-N(6))-methyltransferase RlmF n=1 Tax=Mucilaginibacter sp. TaxID=1882438 RepID=UPI003D0DED29